MKTLQLTLLCFCLFFAGTVTTTGQTKFETDLNQTEKNVEIKDWDFYLQKMGFEDMPELHYTGDAETDMFLYKESKDLEKLLIPPQRPISNTGLKVALNDDACNATALGVAVAGGTSVLYDITGATAQVDEPSPGAGSGPSSCNSLDGWCSFETGVQNSVWYTFIAPGSGNVRIEAPPGDSQLALWSVGDCSDFSSYTEIAANDDGGIGLSATIESICGTLGLTPGATYYIQLDGFSGLQLMGNLTLTMIPVGSTPSNDDACNAASIAVGSTATFDNTCATPDGPSPGPGSGFFTCESQDGWCDFETEVQNDVWFSFTAPPSGWVSISSGPFDTQLALWSAPDCSDNSSFFEIAANDDDGSPAFTSALEGICLEPGDDYLIQIDGYNGASGVGTLEVLDAAEPYLCNTGGYKIKLCHEDDEGNLKNICVSINSLAAHLAHGDLVGNCEDAIIWPCADTPKPAVVIEGDLYTGQVEDTNGIVDFVLLPNPADENVLIQVGDIPDINTEIRIFDQTMRVIYSQELTNYNTNINLSDFAAGLYIVDIRNAVESSSKKLVVID